MSLSKCKIAEVSEISDAREGLTFIEQDKYNTFSNE